MSRSISRQMILESTDQNCTWLEVPEVISGNLYPNDPIRADLAAYKIYNDLEATLDDKEKSDLFWLEADQLEDWLAGRAIKSVLRAEAAARRLGDG